MPKPQRSSLGQMALNAMIGSIGSIGVAHLSCDCPSCMGKSKAGTTGSAARPPPSEKENVSFAARGDFPCIPSCHHGTDHCHSSAAAAAPRKPSTGTSTTTATSSATQTRSSSSQGTAPGRSDKINSLLKADKVADVFDVFNTTVTTNDEKTLATQIQNAAKDCKSYNEAKDRIMEVCEEDVQFEALIGLLAKFRHERNLLTTAVLSSNKEREKALLCVKRVDDLMYMLQNVSKRPKDSSNDNFFAQLNDIIAEVHDLGKAPSTLYDELLDIKDEHLRLVDDHDDMHQKFADVDSCHQKLHTSHDKLQATHTKLLQDFSEMRKKASLMNGLKNDVTRLEKSVEKSKSESHELKKEIEKLTAELAKVNALKHENAQLKKKVTTLSVVAPMDDPVPTSVAPHNVVGKKRKGKKGPQAVTEMPAEQDDKDALLHLERQHAAEDKAKSEELAKAKKSHEKLSRELVALRENLTQLDGLRQQAEQARDQAIEKYQVEQATSRNWHELSDNHMEEKGRLRAQLEHFKALASKLQTTINQLEQSRLQAETELTEQKQVHAQLKVELETRSRTPATSVSSQPTSVIGSDTVRLLRKIKTETSQLVRDLDESTMYGTDLFVILTVVQNSVRRVCNEVERDIEEILGVKSISDTPSVPEAALPFRYVETGSSRNFVNPAFGARTDYSPQDSPRQLFSSPPIGLGTGTTSLRPTVPPGFGDVVPNPASIHNFGRVNDSFAPSRFTASTSTSPSILNPSPSHLYNQTANNGPGPIGSRPSGAAASAAPTASKPAPANVVPSPIGTPAPSSKTVGSVLGNGATGVDWSMWSKTSK